MRQAQPDLLASVGVISLREIEAIVRDFPASFQPTRIEPLGMAGGMSGAQFWRIQSAAGPLVLRQWPSEHPSAERLRFIHDVLFHAQKRGVAFLAVPIRTASGESFVRRNEHLWELSPWMPGSADYERSPSEKKLRAAMIGLARFHRAVSDYLVGADKSPATAAHAVTRHLTRIQALTDSKCNDLAGAIAETTWPELADSARLFVAMLPAILPSAESRLVPLVGARLPIQPCLRDIWHDHVLFTGDEVTGVIDFGAVDIDTPATDIARLLGSLVGDDAAGWRAGIDAYATIRPLSAEEELAASALNVSGTILAGCNWLRWIYIENRTFDDVGRITERFRRIVSRCAKLGRC